MYPHLLYKEITEQPKVLANTLSQYLSVNYILKMTNPPLETQNIEKYTSVYIIACGTSYHAGLIAKNIIEELAKIPVFVEYASEFRLRNPLINENTLVIAISQSGTTTDTLKALEQAKQLKGKTLALVNVSPSPMTEIADGSLLTLAGQEKSIASTKAFTAQLLVLTLLAIRLAQARGESKETCQEILNQLNNLPELTRHAIATNEAVINIAEKLAKKENIIYIARGIAAGLAYEGALKIKETSYIHCEGSTAGEIKHGPFALLEEKVPVIMLAFKEESQKRNLNLIKAMQARKSPVYVITEHDNSELIDVANGFLPIPSSGKYLRPILGVVPMQLLAYHIARIKGLDVDHPRSLTKSVLEVD